MNTIEQSFYDEIREKKRIGNNIRCRKNKVHSDKILFPYDFLSKKQREKLNGAITMSNIYDNLTYVEFKKLDNKDRLAALNYLSKKFKGRKQLAEHWNVKV